MAFGAWTVVATRNFNRDMIQPEIQIGDLPTPHAPLLAVERVETYRELCVEELVTLIRYGGARYLVSFTRRGIDGNYRHCEDLGAFGDPPNPERYANYRWPNAIFGQTEPKWSDPMAVPWHYTGYVSGYIGEQPYRFEVDE
jgi:hypothetical protein